MLAKDLKSALVEVPDDAEIYLIAHNQEDFDWIEQVRSLRHLPVYPTCYNKRAVAENAAQLKLADGFKWVIG